MNRILASISYKYRSFLIFLYETLIFSLSWFFSFALRFNFSIPGDQFDLMKSILPLILLIELLSYSSFGLFKASWRYLSLIDLKNIILSGFISSLILVFLLFIGGKLPGTPRSILILNLIITIILSGGSRFIYRYLCEHKFSLISKGSTEKAVIYGIDSNSISIIKELLKSNKWNLIAAIDDNKKLHGQRILSLNVIGGLELISVLKDVYGVSTILIIKNPTNQLIRKNLYQLALKFKISLLAFPPIEDFINRKFSLSNFHKITIEDLLRRDPVNLDISGLKDFLFKKTVMVTGGGGSIGSELCRQILSFKPSKLICFDISEFALYNLEQNLKSLNYKTQCIYVVGDIKNQIRLEDILKTFSPKIIFHAAAYKHVPMMEQGNVSEAVLNNAYGTYTLAKVAKKTKVEKFILVSTDKAVNPTNIMGASKRLAEIICQILYKNSGTLFIIVRFGNVLGSSGSVVPKFEEQIKNGGPVTITHPKITRYFMSIPEASQLVIQAGLIGKGGDIFVLDMGKPIKILDLAKDMITLSGYRVSDIGIKFTGLRPGEKLHEELSLKEEEIISTKHEKLNKIQSKNFDGRIIFELLKWFDEIKYKKDKAIKKEIRQWVPEYSPDLDLN